MNALRGRELWLAMKRRFDAKDDGVLVDRHGYELGRVEALDVRGGRVRSITLVVEGGRGEGDVLPSTAVGELESVPRDGGAGETPADRVWATYVELMAPRDKTLHPEERRIINAALKVASADECSLAVAGCKGSGWHMGENPQRRKYNRITQILKGRGSSSVANARTTRETIDFFIEKYEQSGRTFGFTSEASAKIEVLKDRVRRGTKRAEEARRILKTTYGIETQTRDGVGAAVRYEFIETGVPGREES